ncbi:MAG: FtsX-like permease family protein [Armatimonadota bacterium]
MLEVIQHLLSRKTRTVFTIIGVAVGVFSLLVMGAMAEHFNLLGKHYKNIFAGKLFVCEKPDFWYGEGLLHQSKLSEVGKVEGVASTVPIEVVPLARKQFMVMGSPEVLVGIDPSSVDTLYDRRYLLSNGLWIDKEDTYEATIGWDIARQNDKKENEKITLNNYPFLVKGIMKKTGSIEDRHVIVPLKVAQAISSREGFITAIVVKPEAGVNLDQLARSIKNKVPNVEVVTPSDFENHLARSLVVWNFITLGASMLAAITGALCIIMTLLIAVNDRIPEIGLKKAIGASSVQIMQEYLYEAMFLSIAGWILGTLLGSLFIKIFEHYISTFGISLFEITVRLLVLSLLWSVCIGVLSGLYPSWQAASIDPIKAIKR